MALTKTPIELSSTPGIVDNSNATAITIDSSESVGIGNSVASSMDGGANNLVIGSGSGTEGMTIYSGTSNSGTIYFADGASGDDRFRGQINYAHSDNSLNFRTNASSTPNMTIDSSGRVGIGTSVPAVKLDVNGDGLQIRVDGTANTSRGIMLRNTGTAEGQIQTDGNLHFIQEDANRYMRFSTANTERMRISSAGHTMFATTDDAPGAGNTQSGVAIRGGSDNRSFFSASSNYAMHLNRNTNDGEILYFAKNGTAVGSIGTNAATMYVSAPQAGGMKYSYYNSTNAVMLPVTTAGANADATHDLGYGSSRFRDLYLSGGVYLGGTGAANKLDDYETGNWAPSIGAGITAVGTVTTSGTYTKVGRIVTLQFTLSATTSLTVIGNNNVLCGTLPFQMGGDQSMSFMLLNSAFGESKPQSGWSYNLYSSTAMAATPNLYATLTYVTN